MTKTELVDTMYESFDTTNVDGTKKIRGDVDPVGRELTEGGEYRRFLYKFAFDIGYLKTRPDFPGETRPQKIKNIS